MTRIEEKGFPINPSVLSIEDLANRLNAARMEALRLEKKTDRTPEEQERLEVKRAEIDALEAEQQQIPTIHDGLKAEQLDVVSKDGPRAIVKHVVGGQRTIDPKAHEAMIKEAEARADPSLKDEISALRALHGRR